MGNPRLFNIKDTGSFSAPNAYDTSITLRDIFAGLAMNGMMAHPASFNAADKSDVAYAYKVADAMLKARGEAASGTPV